MLPRYVKTSGALGKMNRSECKVYIAMVLLADWGKRGKVIVRHAGDDNSLAADTGLNERDTRRAVLSLIRMGIIVLDRKGHGNGVASEYRIVAAKPDTDALFDDVQSGHGRPVESGHQCPVADSQTGHNATPNRTLYPSKADTSVLPLRNQKSEHTSDACASGAQTSPPAKGQRKPNPIWDAIVARFYPEGVVGEDQSKAVGKIVKDFKTLPNVSASEILVRADRLRSLWGEKGYTPRSLLNHWQKFSTASIPHDHDPDLDLVGLTTRTPTTRQLLAALGKRKAALATA